MEVTSMIYLSFQRSNCKYAKSIGLHVFPCWTAHFFVWTAHFGWTARLNYTMRVFLLKLHRQIRRVISVTFMDIKLRVQR